MGGRLGALSADDKDGKAAGIMCVICLAAVASFQQRFEMIYPVCGIGTKATASLLGLDMPSLTNGD